jgi:hypothetical protein
MPTREMARAVGDDGDKLADETHIFGGFVELRIQDRMLWLTGQTARR